jgi:hypothetical protein
MQKSHRVKGIPLLLAAGLCLWSCGTQDPDAQQDALSSQLRKGRSSVSRSISIRNGLERFVEYTSRPADSQDSPAHRILDQGEIDTFPGDTAIIVTFTHGIRIMRQELTPGHTYSFVRDDQGEVSIKEGWHGLENVEDLAPFVATPLPVAEKMLELAQVGKGDVVYDLGCGDGRIVILAAQKFGARGVGIDFNPKRILESQAGAREAGVEDRVDFRLGDVLKADFTDATVITTYLLTHSNEKLRPLLEAQLKPGTLVVTHNYRVPGWEAKEIDSRTVELEPTDVHILFLYRR